MQMFTMAPIFKILVYGPRRADYNLSKKWNQKKKQDLSITGCTQPDKLKNQAKAALTKMELVGRKSTIQQIAQKSHSC